MIDLTAFRNAVQQLSSAIQEQAREPERVLLRAGLIQTFEFTYELSHKMLKRYLMSVTPSPEQIDLLTFEGLIRLGDEAGLLLSPIAVWKDFRKARTETSHTYNEEKAVAVLNRIPAFEQEAKHLLERLRERIESHDE
ncbi:HI0074 family nucleotidyltransferase substrate-binding subunit [Terriglobus saanensis]|uniref:Nucleotidyltransferase substrate binding protein, HI0074 family n=1 Tax=Terriglobus saanensis (strain ATCC BAA-1853 / DSM 23119 / SP1PR4) TaxID=401053 RepID=E8V202_TERSS|nr:HI0074 family nucleotidyltransferase substrate-binding subunit [Terriglobus saanensis]ADV84559.1 nucleotidyltransferase substrate binding protein, HI0074 family [Terriglobus saanensis SP1PR4]